jgi:FHS family L-fucose permease-like MFS transporter
MGFLNFGSKNAARSSSVDSTGRRLSAVDAIENSHRRGSVNDHAVTGAAGITTRQSIIPVSLVTVLFFMWGFAYGLLDVLNKHFQETLHISAAASSGLQGYVKSFNTYFLYTTNTS